MQEPKFGWKNLIKAKREGKVKAFFSLLIPTEGEFGTLEMAGFKIVTGASGDFISLPNRAVKSAGQQIVDVDSGQPSQGTLGETKYYNNIRFETQEKYNAFRKELNDNVLPMIQAQLATV